MGLFQIWNTYVYHIHIYIYIYNIWCYAKFSIRAITISNIYYDMPNILKYSKSIIVTDDTNLI